MSLQGAYPLVEQIYTVNNCHFRPAVADQVIGLLLSRALRQMRKANPDAFHVLVVCSWNSTGGTVHSEMNATADLCRSETLSEIGSVAARHTNKAGSSDATWNRTLWQTSPCPGLYFRPTCTTITQGLLPCARNFCRISSAPSAMMRSCSIPSSFMPEPAVPISARTCASLRTKPMSFATSTTTTTVAYISTSRLHCASRSPLCCLVWPANGTRSKFSGCVGVL